MAFDDFQGAKSAFLRAMKSSRDTILLNNFNKLLSSVKNKRDVAGDAYDEFRKAQTYMNYR